MRLVVPNSWGGTLREYNTCHDTKGQFCSSPSVEGIKDYLKLVVRMRSTRQLPEGWVYAGAEDYILQHGKAYESQPLTPEEERVVRDASRGLTFPIKECWRNSARMVTSDTTGQLRFAEGWVDAGLGIPIRHAWVTIHGKVVDPTLRLRDGTNRRIRGIIPPDYGYFGVEFTSKDVVEAMMRTKVYDSIIQPEMRDSPHMYVKRGQPLPKLAKEVAVSEYNKCHDAKGRFCDTPTGESAPAWKPVMSRNDATVWAKNSVYKKIGTVVVSRWKARKIMEEGFSLDAPVSLGRVWGKGVYVGAQAGATAFWTKAKKDFGKVPVTLKVMLNIQHPLVVTDADLLANGGDPSQTMLRKAAEEKGFDWQQVEFKQIMPRAKELGVRDSNGQFFLASHYKAAAVTEFLASLGYDSVIVKSPTGRKLLDEEREQRRRNIDWRMDPADEMWAGVGGGQVVVFDPKRVVVFNVSR